MAGWITLILAVIGGTVIVKHEQTVPPVTTATAPTATTPPPVVTPLPTVEPPATVHDADTSVPGRVRPVQPVCTSDDIERAKRYAKERGYEYLANRCDLVHEWQQAGGDVVNWLCSHGYDSPLSVRTTRLSYDRQINVRDKVAIWKRPDGLIHSVFRIPDWNHIPPWATNAEGAPGISGTVLEQSPNAWLLSSYGKAVLVRYDSGSLVLDQEGVDWIGARYHDETIEAPIDPHARFITATVELPCWRDEPVFLFYNKAQKEIGH